MQTIQQENNHRVPLALEKAKDISPFKILDQFLASWTPGLIHRVHPEA